MISKYKKQFTKVYQDDSKAFEGYTEDDFYLRVEKEEGRKNLYIVRVYVPSGGMVYDAYFRGTFAKAMEDAFRNIDSYRPWEINKCRDCLNCFKGEYMSCEHDSCKLYIDIHKKGGAINTDKIPEWCPLDKEGN